MKNHKGMGGHQSARPKTHIWLTPPSIIKALGHFDLDPCAAPDPTVLPTADHYFGVKDDGLSKDWFGRVFLNPPYEAQIIGKWLKKLDDHACGTALIFARTETRNFFDHIWNGLNSSAVLFLKGRLHFHDRYGVRSDRNSGAPSALIAYGAQDAEILHGSGIEGRFVPINFQTAAWIFMRELSLKPKSWTSLVVDMIRLHGGKASLSELYQSFSGHPKTAGNANWDAKIRQTCRRAVKQGSLQAQGNGQYSLAV